MYQGVTNDMGATLPDTFKTHSSNKHERRSIRAISIRKCCKRVELPETL